MPLTEGSRRQGMPLTEGSRRQEMPLTFEPDTKCCHITQGATMVRLWGAMVCRILGTTKSLCPVAVSP